MPPMRRNGMEIIPRMLQNHAVVSVELTESRQLGQPKAGGAVINTASASKAR